MMETARTESTGSLSVVIQEMRGYMVRVGYSRGYRRRFDRT
jgi:hypothetical protein